MLDQILATWHALPYAGPAILAGLVLALLSLRLGQHRSRRDRIGLELLVWWTVVTIVTATTPIDGAWQPGAAMGGCTLTGWTPLPPTRWLEMSSHALNVWYFVPAGFAAMLLDGKRRWWTAGLVLLSPILCELAQWLIPAAGRDCTLEDVANPWSGVLVGFVIGALTVLVHRSASVRSLSSSR